MSNESYLGFLNKHKIAFPSCDGMLRRRGLAIQRNEVLQIGQVDLGQDMAMKLPVRAGEPHITHEDAVLALFAGVVDFPSMLAMLIVTSQTGFNVVQVITKEDGEARNYYTVVESAHCHRWLGVGRDSNVRDSLFYVRPDPERDPIGGDLWE